MKKGVYLVFAKEDTIKKVYPGVYKKIINQVNSFRQNNIDMDIKFFSASYSLVDKILKRIPLELGLNFYEELKYEKLDYIYLRKPAINSSVIRYLKSLKVKYKCKVLMEIPTYPYDDEFGINLLNYSCIKKEKKYREKLNEVVDRIVTFSEDKSIWNIKTIRISNGINIDEITPINEMINSEINMIAVATHNFWHGYDRLIEGLKIYQQKNIVEQKAIKLHIVGEGPNIPEYKQLVNDAQLNDMVFFYGKLYGKELDEIYERCNLGIDALARHRSGTYFNSSLKGKEYCAKGLPIISGVKTELDDFPDYKFYLRVPADETPIDISYIVDFFEECYSGNSGNELKEIRNFAELNFSMPKVLEPIVEYLRK